MAFDFNKYQQSLARASTAVAARPPAVTTAAPTAPISTRAASTAPAAPAPTPTATAAANPYANQMTGLLAGNNDGYMAKDEINAAYMNIYGREADQAGLDYWYNEGKAGNINESNLKEALWNGAQGSQNIAARDDIANTFLQDGKFSTPGAQTWSDPAKFSPELNTGVNNKLAWNAADNKWELPEAAPVAPTPDTVTGGPAQTNQFPTNFDRQVTDSELVEMRVANLVKNGHPLLEQARQRTLEQFAARGLLNSSVAAQAAQEAVLAKAIEMAGPDAATMNRQGMANQSFQNEFAGREQIQNYGRENQYQDYLYNKDLMSLEYGFKADLLGRELSMRDQFSQTGEGRTELANSRQRYQGTITQYQRDYQDQYQQIVMAYDMDDGSKQAALSNLNERYDAMYETANAVYEKIPGWAQEWLVVRA